MYVCTIWFAESEVSHISLLCTKSQCYHGEESLHKKSSFIKAVVQCFAAHLEHLTVCKEEKEQTTTPISLGVACRRVYLSTI